ncbi:MAG: diguanylate cyclase [Chloroflexia bacterium]
MLIPALNAANYTWSYYALPTICVMAAVLLLGVLALLREGRTLVSVSFFLVTLTIGIWLFCFSALYLANNSVTADRWVHAAYLGVPAIPAAGYQFTVAVLRTYARHRRQVWLIWLLAAVFSAAGIATNTIVMGLYHYWWGFYPLYGPLGAPFCIFFFGILIACMVHFVQGYRAAPAGVPRLRIRWFMTAFAIAYLGSADFAAVYGVPLYPFGYLALLGFLVVAAWTIWRYHLIDITPAFAASHILATMTDALLVLDPAGVIRLVNQAATTLLGMSETALLGEPIGEVLGSPPPPADPGALSPGSARRDYELAYHTPAGTSRWLSVAPSVMYGRHGEPEAIVCIVQDLTAREEAAKEIRRLNATLEARVSERTALLEATNLELEREVAERTRAERLLQQLATVDDLTGLWNRREMERMLDDDITRSRRFRHSLGLLMVDIDHFKLVNDTYGHQAGDAVVRWVAEVLLDSVRSTDRVSRYGGDEFLVVLPETTEPKARQVAEKIRGHLVAWPFSGQAVGGESMEIPITVSIGVADFPADGSSKTELIAAADEALYEAKRRGRNCTVIFVRALASMDRSLG